MSVVLDFNTTASKQKVWYQPTRLCRLSSSVCWEISTWKISSLSLFPQQVVLSTHMW